MFTDGSRIIFRLSVCRLIGILVDIFSYSVSYYRKRIIYHFFRALDQLGQLYEFISNSLSLMLPNMTLMHK